MMSESISLGDGQQCHPTSDEISSFRIFYHRGQALVLCKVSSACKSQAIALRTASGEYMCEFVKELDAEFRTSLEQIIVSIDISQSFAIDNHAFRLYKLLDYEVAPLISYNMAHPAYAEEVIVKKGTAKSSRVISNCFRKKNRCFYFLSNEEQQSEDSICEIVDTSQTKIFGFRVKIGKLSLCLTLQELLHNVASPFVVRTQVEASLKKIVFVHYDSSHCTGMLLSRNLILTVRHLFNTTKPLLGTVVKVRIYPYTQLKTAKLIQSSTKFVDLMLLQLIEQRTAFYQSGSVQQSLSELPKSKPQQVRLGMKIYAIGFGKYSYQNVNFNSIDLLLPTITYGVVSKIISLNSEKVYFKTDSSLYNGYSGCPIWHEGAWIGNTVFIVKNKISMSKHPKHNFNYSREFIQLFLLRQREVEESEEFQEFFRRVQKIHTRKQFKIMARL